MLSIDVGFGNVKVYDGENAVGFPSVYTPVRGSYIPSTDPSDQVLEFDGEKYHVGKTALNMAGFAPFDKEDLLRHKIFILNAICFISDSEKWEDSLALGLPIGDYGYMAEKLQELKGSYNVVHNGKKRVITITDIKVYAQSEAVYKLLLEDDKTLNDKIIGIVDIGQKTVDYAYFNEGTFLRDRSGSMEQGVINSYQAIADAVADKLGFEIADYKAKKYIDRVPQESEQAFKDMALAIRDRLIRKHWNFKEMDALYIVGGGTNYIASYFKDAPYIELDETKAVFANAYGFYKER